jgi:signal transduction histidine kinase/DNA-binding response OmpR family regulator
MTSLDFVLMTILCYVLGLLLGLIPGASAEFWTVAGICYAIKTAIWLMMRIPLLLPIDRWCKRGMPPDDNDPKLIRSIYYFPYDFSVFYGFMIFLFYTGMMLVFIRRESSIQLGEHLMLPGMMFALAIGAGAIAVGVPVNLLLTAKFSRRLSEREVDSFDEIPGKKISLQTKMATVAVALGCAPSLLLFSILSFLQYDSLYLEAGRMGDTVAQHMSAEAPDSVYRWTLAGTYPFATDGDDIRFIGARQPEAKSLRLMTQATGNREFLERRVGYVLRFSPGSSGKRGVIVKVPEPADNFLVLTLVLLLACLWPLVTSVLTVRTIVKPVEVIAATFHRIIGRGRTEGTDIVPVVYKDEVGRLAFNANRTINILTEARGMLEESANDLAEKNHELEQAYRTKGEFLANMSHELRTPLNAIIGFSRLMKRKLKDTLPPRQKKNLELIQQSGEQLLTLVNDLLDFEKIEAGKLTMRREPVDLQELLSGLKETLEPVADEKKLVLSFETEGMPSTISSDRDRLRQVLTNLITNGLKYSDEGTVTVTVETRDDRVAMIVTDQGIGMTEQQVEKIFDPFHQVDGSETRERGGVGLGLAIVGRLVVLLEGEIEVSSERGKGSTFVLTLPIVDAVEKLLPQGHGPEVLVVDDNADYLETMYTELTESDFRVNVARSGEQALERLQSLRPSAILLDIVMPEMDGWEVLAEIRKKKSLDGVPVVITSVVDEKPKGLDIEVAGWLTKPFEIQALKDLLQRESEQGELLDGELLVVEDDPQTAQLLEQSFEEVGISAQVAHSESVARRLLDKAIPSVLILDLNLEEGSGWSVLSYLRTLEGNERTRVFIYTASDLSEAEREKLSENLVTIVHKHGKDSLSQLVSSIVS